MNKFAGTALTFLVGSVAGMFLSSETGKAWVSKASKKIISLGDRFLADDSVEEEAPKGE